MGAYAGTNTPNSGLVFAMDMKNAEKSWKGKPTTNYANTDTLRTFVEHNPGGYGNDSTISDAPEKGTGWKKITVHNRGNNFRIAQFPYRSQATGTTRTYSLEYDVASSISSTDYYIRGDGSTGFGSSNYLTGPGKIEIVHTNSSGGNQSLALFLNHNNANQSGLNDTIYFRYYQVEEGSFATPFTETSRSSTQSILDLADEHTITINDLTYNSDNTFKFGGSGEYATISTGALGALKGDITLIGWVNQLSGNGPHSTILATHLSYRQGMKLMSHYHSNGAAMWIGNDDGTNSYIVTSGSSIDNSGIRHIAATRNSSTGYVKLYLDGQLIKNTNTSITGDVYTPTGGARIGVDYHSGSYGPNSIIHSTFAYNRILTDTEIEQHYEATKYKYLQQYLLYQEN